MSKQGSQGFVINIVNRSGSGVPHQFIEAWSADMVRLLAKVIKDPKRLQNTEMVIAFLDVKEARKVNSTFRGHDYPTDVLSFNSNAPDIIGELVLCPNVISRQAKEHGFLVREEMGYLILHGLLHLLGYDHEGSAAAAKAMYTIQEKVFAELLELSKNYRHDSST